MNFDRQSSTLCKQFTLSNEHSNTSSDFRAVCTLTQNKTCLKVKKKNK